MNEKGLRITMKITSILCGLFILLCVISPELYPSQTIEEHTQILRTAAMIGFLGWVFTYVSTLEPIKQEKEN